MKRAGGEAIACRERAVVRVLWHDDEILHIGRDVKEAAALLIVQPIDHSPDPNDDYFYLQWGLHSYNGQEIQGDTMALVESITPERMMTEFRETGSADFGFAHGQRARFRVAIFRQRGQAALVARLIPSRILSFDEIGLPQQGWFEGLLKERLLIASILIVLLCVVAIRMAPPYPPESAHGAKP